ncbi:T9SS type A sorting domain-containing protein [Paenimyroides ceti]
MKKIIILFALCLLITQSNAQQQLYTFSAFQQDYTDLVSPISVNNGQVWKSNGFGSFQVPFSFEIAGNNIAQFFFIDDNFFFMTDTSDMYLMTVSGIDIQDKNYAQGVSQSPISYKVEGTSGNRILKIEVKNAGSETEVEVKQTNNLFLNFQIWIYEGTNVIEYRYGDSNITANDMTMLEEKNSLLIGMGDEELNYGFFVYGNETPPSFAELVNANEGSEDQYRNTSYPVNGTVYRFTPTTTVSTDDFNKTKFNLYPNPVTDVVHVSLEKITPKEYSILDANGKTIRKGSLNALENTLDLGALNSGAYFIKIGNTTKKIIKK